MTTAPRKRVLSGRKISMGLMHFDTELRLIPSITDTFVDAPSGTNISNTLDLGTGASQ